MKEWNFKVKSNVQEIIEKLDASFGLVDGFFFNLEKGENESVTFKVRKRGLYAFQIMSVNKIIVNGKILKTDTENETNVEIYFTKYFLMKLIIFNSMLTGLVFLIAIISKISNNSAYMYILVAIAIAVGIVLTWINLQKKHEKDIQEYKTLISKILES